VKIAFRHPKSEHAADLLRRLVVVLGDHEVFSWPIGETAPANDIRILLALGPVGRGQLEPLSKLELLQTVSAGFESVDINAAAELGVWVSNAPAALTGNASSVAEFAVMLLIGASRRLLEAIQSEADQRPAVGTSNKALSGKRICIVGLGSVGRHLVDRLRPFGMTIVATNQDPSKLMADVTVYPAGELKHAVTNADYVVICVPGSSENENLINAQILGAMKRGAILVNVARGNVVDELALCSALSSGQISAVGLDVVRAEPMSADNPLRKFPQALITPHIAGDTDLTLSGTLTFIAEVVSEWDGGTRPGSIVNQPQNPRKVLL
jgi:phosphoglycerate dehydrogenase-like enzyme